MQGKVKSTDKLPFVALYEAVSRSETKKNSSDPLVNEQYLQWAILWVSLSCYKFQFPARVPVYFRLLKRALLTGLTFLLLYFPLMERILDERKDTVNRAAHVQT